MCATVGYTFDEDQADAEIQPLKCAERKTWEFWAQWIASDDSLGDFLALFHSPSHLSMCSSPSTSPACARAMSSPSTSPPCARALSQAAVHSDGTWMSDTLSGNISRSASPAHVRGPPQAPGHTGTETGPSTGTDAGTSTGAADADADPTTSCGRDTSGSLEYDASEPCQLTGCSVQRVPMYGVLAEHGTADPNEQAQQRRWLFASRGGPAEIGQAHQGALQPLAIDPVKALSDRLAQAPRFKTCGGKTLPHTDPILRRRAAPAVAS